MSSVSLYLLGIVGVVMLTVLIDLIMPSGQVNRYIKGVMSLVIIFVIASPIPNILKKGIDFNSLFQPATVVIDEEYLDTVKRQQIWAVENGLKNLLTALGISGAEIQIWATMEDNRLKISHIFVETSKVVLSAENAHIDKYAVITGLIVGQTGVSEEQVVFNE